MKVKVTNMCSSRTGNPVANQFIIDVGDTTYFQSYETIIAKKENGQVTLDAESWDYSRTTLKYLRDFLGSSDSTNVICKKIDAGVYRTENLNGR